MLPTFGTPFEVGFDPAVIRTELGKTLPRPLAERRVMCDGGINAALPGSGRVGFIEAAFADIVIGRHLALLSGVRPGLLAPDCFLEVQK